jgi:hypothetical protein
MGAFAEGLLVLFHKYVSDRRTQNSKPVLRPPSVVQTYLRTEYLPCILGTALWSHLHLHKDGVLELLCSVPLHHTGQPLIGNIECGVRKKGPRV